MRYLLPVITLLFFKITIMAQKGSSEIKRCIYSPDVYRGQVVYRTVDKMPVFGNGDFDFMNYISKNLTYHEANKESSPIRSTFRITCVIDTFGKAQNVCIITSYDYYEPVEKQMVDLIRNSSGWAPGMLNGKKVCVRLMIPLSIHLK